MNGNREWAWGMGIWKGNGKGEWGMRNGNGEWEMRMRNQKVIMGMGDEVKGMGFFWWRAGPLPEIK